MKARRVAGVLLAAGGSVRFGGGRPKQLAPFAGEPLVRRAAREALASRLDELVLVVGCAAEAVIEAVAGLAVEVARNPAWADGQGTSVAAGIRAVSKDCSAAIFLNVDQPWLDRAVVDRILAVHDAARDAIVVPSFGGRRRSPVLFPRGLFHELAALPGDAGGRQLLARHADDVVEVDFPTETPFEDVDTPEDLRRLEARREEDEPPAR